MASLESDNSKSLVETIRNMSEEDVCRVLSAVALDLTLCVRAAYESDSMGISNPPMIRRLNECQHFLLGILRRYLFSEKVDARFLINRLEECLSDARVGHEFLAALERGVNYTQKAAGTKTF